MKRVPDEQIDAFLLELPNIIFKKAQEMIEARYEYETREAEYENALDKAYLSFKASGEGKTIKELEAEARTLYYELRLTCIQAEAKWKALENKVDQLRLKFDAARSAVKLRVAEIERLER